MIRVLGHLRPAIVAIGALLALSACSVARPDAAVIDGESVSDEQLAGHIVVYEFLSALSGTSCGQPVDDETPQSACARFTLSNLIQERLIAHYARANDVSVPDATIADAIAQVEQSVGTEQLDGLLKDNGLTRKDLDAIAARLLLFEEVLRAVAEDEVTDEQLREAYGQNRGQFTDLHTWHILLQTEAEAARVREQLTARNFRELATEFSIDPSVEQNAGDLGTLPASGLDPAFVEAALALEIREISEPVQTQFGWHLIRLMRANVTPFADARSELLEQASAQAFESWFRDRLDSAEITINPKYGRLDPDSGQVVPIRSTATGSPADGATPSATP